MPLPTMNVTPEEKSDECPSNQITKPSIKVLFDGFSRLEEKTGDMFANCTCTFIKGHKFNIIVDTMTAWDGERIISALSPVHPDSINYVVCTHGHSDHIGNNNLFKHAFHIVGCSMNTREHYINVDLDKGKEFVIEPGIRVIPTPGHTATDVTVLVDTGPQGSSPTALGLVAVTGDLFEREDDLKDASIWRDLGGSEQPDLQQANRERILEIADYIVPGHGPMFKNPLKPGVSNASDQQLAGSSTS